MVRKKGKILLIILIFMMVFNFIYPTVYADGPISDIAQENASMAQNSSSSTGSTNSSLGAIVDWGVRNIILSNQNDSIFNWSSNSFCN